MFFHLLVDEESAFWLYLISTNSPNALDTHISRAYPSSAMSPSTPHISSHLRQLIYYNLDNNLIRNALFIASRLHAYEPRSSEASYLLALCHLQSGQVRAAWDYSRNSGSRGTHLGCSYVYAQASLELGKYIDGITALERSKALWASKNHWSKCLQETFLG